MLPKDAKRELGLLLCHHRGPETGTWAAHSSLSIWKFYHMPLLSQCQFLKIDCLRKEKENVCYNKLLNQGTSAILYYYYYHYYLVLLLRYGLRRVTEPHIQVIWTWNHHISYVNIRNCYSGWWKSLYFVFSIWLSLCMWKKANS